MSLLRLIGLAIILLAGVLVAVVNLTGNTLTPIVMAVLALMVVVGVALIFIGKD